MPMKYRLNRLTKRLGRFFFDPIRPSLYIYFLDCYIILVALSLAFALDMYD